MGRMFEIEDEEPSSYIDPSGRQVLVLYEEDFEDDAFWYIQPLWARQIGLRVLQYPSEPAPETSAAVDLPDDILLLIAEYAFQEYRFSKSNIMQLSLTCRSWANVRYRHQRLFVNVLRFEPVEMVDTLQYVGLVARHTRNCSFYYEDDSVPTWVQRYLSLISINRRNLARSGELDHQPEEFSMSLHINFDAVLAHRSIPACRSVFTLCPRPLPAYCAKHIKSLHLSDYRFRCFSDLMHLVWELPSLQRLGCENLSWGQVKLVRPPVFRSRHKDDLRINAIACADITPLVWILTSMHKLKSEDCSGILAESDALALFAIIQSFVDGVTTYHSLSNTEGGTLGQWWDMQWRCIDNMCTVGCSGRGLGMSLKIGRAQEDALAPSTDRELRIVSFGFSLLDGSLSIIESFEWTDIEKQLNVFAQTMNDKLRVSFGWGVNGFPSLEACASSATHISAKLAKTCNSSGMEFVRTIYHNDIWDTASSEMVTLP